MGSAPLAGTVGGGGGVVVGTAVAAAAVPATAGAAGTKIRSVK